jgi:hypothetical protein
MLQRSAHEERAVYSDMIPFQGRGNRLDGKTVPEYKAPPIVVGDSPPEENVVTDENMENGDFEAGDNFSAEIAAQFERGEDEKSIASEDDCPINELYRRYEGNRDELDKTYDALEARAKEVQVCMDVADGWSMSLKEGPYTPIMREELKSFVRMCCEHYNGIVKAHGALLTLSADSRQSATDMWDVVAQQTNAEWLRLKEQVMSFLPQEFKGDEFPFKRNDMKLSKQQRGGAASAKVAPNAPPASSGSKSEELTKPASSDMTKKRIRTKATSSDKNNDERKKAESSESKSAKRAKPEPSVCKSGKPKKPDKGKGKVRDKGKVKKRMKASSSEKQNGEPNNVESSGNTSDKHRGSEDATEMDTTSSSSDSVSSD